MDVARLLDGVWAYVLAATRWLGLQHPTALAVIAGAILLLLAAGLLRRMGWLRVVRSRAARGPGGVRHLKERLRLRLAEPPTPFAGPAVAGPTLGASEAFEADIEAAANTVLPEVGWQRAAAKQRLRKRLNGHRANGNANGSEAAEWRQLGALSLLDDTQDALAAYARAADLAPDDPELQLLLGVLYLQTGRLEAAEAAFRRQMSLCDGKAGSEAAKYRAGTMLGDVLLAKGAREDALAAYEAAQGEIEALAEREPANARWQRDASVTHDRIGDLLLAGGQCDLALASYRRSLAIADGLAKREPANPGWQHDLSVTHDRIGEALELKGDLDGAIESYRRGLVLAEALARREPERVDWRWDVSVSHDRIGDALLAKDRAAEALDAYRRGLKIAEAVVAAEPMHTGWQRDLAVSYHKIGSLEARCGREDDARELLEKGRAIVARLAHIAHFQAQWRADLSKFDDALKALAP